MEIETANGDPQTASLSSKTSLRVLVQSLTSDIKTFFRQEIELAKVEASEKAAWLGRNAISIAIGGFMAYAGLIVFLIGLGWLAAWALRQAGLQAGLASFVGLAGVGILVVLIGAGFVLAGLKAFSKESIAPQRTIQTIQRLKGATASAPSASKSEPVPRPSSQEIQTQVEHTEDRLGQTLDELGRRLSPQQINARMKQRITQKPYRSGLVAMGLGLVSGLFLTRDSHRS